MSELGGGDQDQESGAGGQESEAGDEGSDPAFRICNFKKLDFSGSCRRSVAVRC